MKNVLYIDNEDDIASIIAKIKDNTSDVIKLVPPKKSAVFSSVVNLKLMKKAAQDSSKEVVVVSKEHSVLSLLAGLKMNAASAIDDDYEVPSMDEGEELPSDVIEDVDSASVEDVPIKTETEEKSDKASKFALAGLGEKFKKTKKTPGAIRVPNFDKFRKRTIFIVVGVIGILFGIFALNFYVPGAKVKLTAQTRRLPVEFKFSVDATASEPDYENKTIPAQAQEQTKTVDAEFKATGQKDVGEKSSGVVTVTNCENSTGITISKNTKFTADSFTFLATQDTFIPGSTFSGGGKCDDNGKADVSVLAAESGDSYNLSPRNYSVSAQPEFVTAYGGQMSGGTSKMVTVVSQEDIDTAKEQLLKQDKDLVQSEFEVQQLEGYRSLNGSFTQVVDVVTVAPKKGIEAEKAKITIKLMYFQFAVSEEHLGELIANQLSADVAENEYLYNNGVKSAIVSLDEKKSNSLQVFNLRSDVAIGIQLNLEELAEELSGKGYSEALNIAKEHEGILGAEISLSPFWVFSMPSRAEKIQIEVETIQ